MFMTEREKSVGYAKKRLSDLFRIRDQLFIVKVVRSSD